MLFTSFEFLIFFACFFALYWSLRGPSRVLLCLVASYFFYGWWDPRFCLLLLWSTLLDFFVGQALSKSTNESWRRVLITISVSSNLILLGIFKYFNFFAEGLETLLVSLGMNADWPTLNIILPVGISFYTFQSISYTVDVYLRRIQVEKNLLNFAAFVALFPQLVAGPIVRAETFLPQLKTDRVFDWRNCEDGFAQILLGFFKKVVVADSAALVVDSVFAGAIGHSSFNILIGVVLYAFQIYGDFSGYSDIAIGTARMLGFDFPRNFRFPYFATSFSDFWTRWHISLSSWLRDYLYIPLGGNRLGKWMTYRNLFITMLLGGLWHGANWTFICWGAMHGGLLVLQRELAKLPFAGYGPRMRWCIQPLQVLGVFAMVCVTWVFFRSSTFGQAWDILGRIFSVELFDSFAIRNRVPLLKACGVAGLLYFCEFIWQVVDVHTWWNRSVAVRLIVYATLIWMILLLGTFGGSSFIYFQF